MSIEFSVVIPTFRRPSELIEAISSALRQRDASVEVFVIDDSPEGSAEKAVKDLEELKGNLFEKSKSDRRNPQCAFGISDGLWQAVRSYTSWTTTTL